MPERVANLGRLGEGRPETLTTLVRFWWERCLLTSSSDSSAKTPAVLGTDLIHEVNIESDTSRPNPGGVEITWTFP